MVALRDASIARWFTADFAAANPQQAKRITDMLAATSPQGYAANCAAVRDADFSEQLSAIHVPTLVIAGTEDAVTHRPPAATLSSARYRGPSTPSSTPPTCPNVQAGAAFSDRVIQFLLAR
jgi:3-oxoadipate enol-lactonase